MIKRVVTQSVKENTLGAEESMIVERVVAECENRVDGQLRSEIEQYAKAVMEGCSSRFDRAGVTMRVHNCTREALKGLKSLQAQYGEDQLKSLLLVLRGEEKDVSMFGPKEGEKKMMDMMKVLHEVFPPMFNTLVNAHWKLLVPIGWHADVVGDVRGEDWWKDVMRTWEEWRLTVALEASMGAI